MDLPEVDQERLTHTFLDLVHINSPSRQEQQAVRYVSDALAQLGLSCAVDAVHNVYARLPGLGAEQPALLVNAHLDTVQPTADIEVRRADGVVRTDGRTILGADDKAGVAAILETMQILQESGMPHPPLDILFTVQEEVGLLGAKAVDFDRLAAKQGVCLDASGRAHQLVVAAPGQNSLEAIFHGRSAHAGLAPEQGRSAIVAAARAIAAMPLGRIDAETTANIGTIQGGQARNIVPERCALVGEARSRSAAKLERQTNAMKTALEDAAAKSDCRLELTVTLSYAAFAHDKDLPIVARCSDALRSLGKSPELTATGGGSDANVFNAHGIATILLGVGYEDIHTTQEHIAVASIVDVTRTLLAVLRGPR